MSVSAISSNSHIQNIAPIGVQQTSGANVRNAFKDLAQALQSGDLPGAQQAFGAIQNAWSTRINNTQTPNGSNSTIQSALKSLGQALQSGDLQGAQQAFTTLQSHLKAHRGHHHHGLGADPDKSAGSATGTSKSTGTNGVLFSSLLQQFAAGSGTGTNGVTDSTALLNAFLQQSGGTSGVAGGTGSRTNQRTFNIVL